MCPHKGSCNMIDSQALALNLKGIRRHMSRPKSQRGELSEHMPKRGKLARGRYWAPWNLRSPG